MKKYELRIWPEDYRAIVKGIKRYEVSENFQDFHTGDTLILKEWGVGSQTFTGRVAQAEIIHMTVIPNFIASKAWCVMGFGPVEIIAQ